MSFDDFDYGTDIEWYRREAGKAHERPVVWTNDLSPQLYHCVHVSATDPTKVSYTPSTVYGRADRQITLKPGRYLSKFYPHLSDKQVQFFAQWHATGSRPKSERFNGAELHFATTGDEIVDVYRNGPSSCMDGEHFDDDDHPCQVYGAGDLAVAHLILPNGRDGEDWIFARALVWPERKVFGRVYPTSMNYSRDGFVSYTESQEASDMLFTRLKEDGYTSLGEGGSLNGAKLSKIEHGDGWMMPYLDNCYGVDDCGDYWRMSTSPDYSCQDTEGYICDRRNECEDCGDRYDADDEGGHVYTRVTGSGMGRGGISVCQHCYENARYCEGTEEHFTPHVEFIRVDGCDYNQAWAEANGYYLSEVSDRWFDGDSDPQAELSDGRVCTQDEKDELEPETDEDDKDYFACTGTLPDVTQVELPL